VPKVVRYDVVLVSTVTIIFAGSEMPTGTSESNIASNGGGEGDGGIFRGNEGTGGKSSAQGVSRSLGMLDREVELRFSAGRGRDAGGVGGSSSVGGGGGALDGLGGRDVLRPWEGNGEATDFGGLCGGDGSSLEPLMIWFIYDRPSWISSSWICSAMLKPERASCGVLTIVAPAPKTPPLEVVWLNASTLLAVNLGSDMRIGLWLAEE
jgi:hypothetical protein